MRANQILYHSTFFLSLVVVLSFWTSVPSFLIRYGNLSVDTLAAFRNLEPVALVFLPLAGIVASIYGFLSRKGLQAFLLGLIPYVPVAFLGIFLLILPGVPMGLMGLGGALMRQEDLRRVLGFVLFGAGLGFWALIVGLAIH